MAMISHTVVPMRVEFSHTDMAGIVHFSEYFRYMEAAEHAFFRERGLSVSQHIGEVRFSWPRVSCRFDYTAPLRFEDEFETHITLLRIGATSLTFSCRVIHGNTLCAMGESTSVCCCMNDGAMKKTPIPAEILARLPEPEKG